VIIGKTKDKTSLILIAFLQKHRLSAIFSLRANELWQMFVLQQAGERRVVNVYLLGGGLAVLLLVVLVVSIIVRRVRSAQRRKALEHFLARYQSGQALVRYVQLNRQCSEEEAYQHLATFVKQYVPFEDHGYIDRMLVHDRQRLLERVRSLLVDDPDEIDKI
jgi:hypothetical protein